MALRTLVLAQLGVSAAGCRDSVEPPAVTAEISLAAGEFTALSGSAISGAVRFPAADPAGAAYLLVGQLASGAAGPAASVRLGGAWVAGPGQWFSPSGPTAADRFHRMLRAREQRMAVQSLASRSLLVQPPRRVPPPTVGTQRTFRVCADLDCATTANVASTARWVGTHAAIFVDDSVSTAVLPTSDVADLGAQFDTVLYPIDVDRFGPESDIDGNGMVLVLLTRQVNKLVPKPDCEDVFVTGYFFGGDIAPGFATQYNNGEVFYGMVPDPGTATTCDVSVTLVKRILPITFIHEFQHMISFNQHVLLRGGQAEVLWLNEGLSHLAEELGALHYDSLGDATTRSRFLIGNMFNAYGYLSAPHEHALITDDGPGTLEERGAAWLFVRYLVDRYGAAVTRGLVQTSLVDVPNVQSVSATPIETLLTRWSLALFVSDLPGFTAPPELRYELRSFRTSFASLHQQDPSNFPRPFPLEPDSSNGASVLVSGALAAGSGAYVMPRQPAGAPGFDLRFTVSFPSGSPAGGGGPQLTVLRLH